MGLSSGDGGAWRPVCEHLPWKVIYPWSLPSQCDTAVVIATFPSIQVAVKVSVQRPTCCEAAERGREGDGEREAATALLGESAPPWRWSRGTEEGEFLHPLSRQLCPQPPL